MSPAGGSTALIHGDGVAARCCAHLLSHAGLPVSIQPGGRARLPAIMLNQPAQELIADVFGLRRPFEGLPRIRKRIVAWGENASPLTMAHAAVVVSEEELLRRLPAGAPPPAPASPSWVVYAAKPLPAGSEERRFGSRAASAAPAELRPGVEPEACWMESLPEGWLFLVTSAPGAGWLLATGAPPGELLRHSRVVKPAIAALGPPAGQFPASPRIAAPLAGDGWIACGTAAMAFDPICGDGTAHAVREGILASAVIKAAARGGDLAALLAHYENRLLAGFLRHLVHAVEYYAAPCGDWWGAEAAAAKAGIEWCGARLGGDPRFRYRLLGFELETLA